MYTGWNYKKTLSDSNSTSVTDFVIQVSLSSSNFDFSHAESNGSDIRFYDETSSQEIPWWIESYDSVGQTATIWVRVNDMSHTHSMYYGNASATFTQIPPLGPFVKRSDNPINSDTATLPEQMIQDDNGTWHILASDQSTGGVQDYVCSTSDPWTGTWTFNKQIFSTTGNACPCAVKDGSTWYIFYTDTTSGSIRSNFVRSSTSLDGTYGSATQILDPVLGTWEDLRVDEPWVWKEGSTWHMMYMADLGGNVEQVGYASASSPTGPWIKSLNNPVIAFTGSNQYDSQTIADPFVYKLNNIYYCGYSASQITSRPWNIAFATSTDLETWTKKNIVLAHGNKTDWDDENSHRGGMILYDGYYYLPYAGHDGSTFKTGLSRQYAYLTATGYPKEQVFDLYVDFSEGLNDQFTLHGGTGGSGSLSGSTLAIASGTGTFSIYQSTQRFRPGYQLEAKVKHTSANGTNAHAGEIGFSTLNGASTVLGTALGADNIRVYSFNSTKYIKQTVASSTVTSSDMAQNYSTNDVVHRIKWASNSSVLFSNDGNADEEITTNIPTVDMPVFAMSYASATNTSTFNVYYIKVRKYAATEPSITLGAEVNLNTAERTTTIRNTGTTFIKSGRTAAIKR